MHEAAVAIIIYPLLLLLIMSECLCVKCGAMVTGVRYSLLVLRYVVGTHHAWHAIILLTLALMSQVILNKGMRGLF